LGITLGRRGLHADSNWAKAAEVAVLVRGDGREHVSQMGFRLSPVAAVAHAMSVGELVDAALDS
jgi:hypothetical protein